VTASVDLADKNAARNSVSLPVQGPIAPRSASKCVE